MNGPPNISESFPTKREVKEWASKMDSEVCQGRYFGTEERKELTFAELVDRYLAPPHLTMGGASAIEVGAILGLETA